MPEVFQPFEHQKIMAEFHDSRDRFIDMVSPGMGEILDWPSDIRHPRTQ